MRGVLTEWLTGMLAIASVFMCLGLWQLIRVELRESTVPWYRNKALRVSTALWMHGIGAILLFSSALRGRLDGVTAPALYLIWAAFGLWLVAKTMIVSVSGWLRTCLVLFALWSAFCAFGALNGWWGA